MRTPWQYRDFHRLRRTRDIWLCWGASAPSASPLPWVPSSDWSPDSPIMYFDGIEGDFFYSAHTPIYFGDGFVAHAWGSVTDFCFDLVVLDVWLSEFHLLLLHIILLLFDNSVKIIHAVWSLAQLHQSWLPQNQDLLLTQLDFLPLLVQDVVALFVQQVVLFVNPVAQSHWLLTFPTRLHLVSRVRTFLLRHRVLYGRFKQLPIALALIFVDSWNSQSLRTIQELLHVAWLLTALFVHLSRTPLTFVLLQGLHLLAQLWILVLQIIQIETQSFYLLLILGFMLFQLFYFLTESFIIFTLLGLEG